MTSFITHPVLHEWAYYSKLGRYIAVSKLLAVDTAVHEMNQSLLTNDHPLSAIVGVSVIGHSRSSNSPGNILRPNKSVEKSGEKLLRPSLMVES